MKTDKDIFEAFSRAFPAEGEAIKFAPDAAETLNYRYMYQAYMFGYKQGQRVEMMKQREET